MNTCFLAKTSSNITMEAMRLFSNMRSMLLLLFMIPLLFAAVDKVRVVTKEELAKKVGKAGDELWLSILGEVYDVSKGTSYYVEGAGYSIFAGRDGSVPFITGTFTPEEAEKGLDALTADQLFNLDTWREFYEKEDRYPFVGLLEGSMFNKDGNPTNEMIAARKQIAEAKVVSDERKKRRAVIIAQRKEEIAARDAAEVAAAAAATGSEL
jgi:predicted heme/steroid binding protein